MAPRDRSSAYLEYDITLTAGEYRKNIQAFDWLEVLIIDNDTLEISYDQGASFVPLRRGLFLHPQSGINGNVILHNTGGSTSIATMATGTADFRDNRLVLGNGGVLPVSISGNSNVEGVAAIGAAIAGTEKPVLVGARDWSGTLKYLQLDTNGSLRTVGGAISDGTVNGGGSRAALVGGLDPADKVRTLKTDNGGKAVNIPHATTGDRLANKFNTVLAATPADLIPAQGAGVQSCVTTLIMSNDGAAANVAIVYAGATEILRVALPISGTVVVPLSVPLNSGNNTAIRVATTLADSVRFAAFGYTETL